MTYWHFAEIDDKARPVMRDGTLIKPGKKYETGVAQLCVSGYHGSERVIDALHYAPGPWVSKRTITGTIVRGDDKLCGTECVHSEGIDATEVLRKFARMCALDVIDKWDAPEVVVRYLKTGDESIRDAARAAAWAAADAADAADAARDAAWDAARDAQNKRLTRMLNKAMKEAGI